MAKSNSKGTKETKTNSTTLLLGIGAVALLLVCLCGWVASTVFINIQRQSCEMIEAGLDQLNPNETQGQPRTAEECNRAVDMAVPFYRVWGWGFAGILAIGAGMTLIAIVTITRRRKTATVTDEEEV